MPSTACSHLPLLSLGAYLFCSANAPHAQDQAGRPLQLSKLLGKRNIVLFFYVDGENPGKGEGSTGLVKIDGFFSFRSGFRGEDGFPTPPPPASPRPVGWFEPSAPAVFSRPPPGRPPARMVR